MFQEFIIKKLYSDFQTDCYSSDAINNVFLCNFSHNLKGTFSPFQITVSLGIKTFEDAIKYIKDVDMKILKYHNIQVKLTEEQIEQLYLIREMI